MIDKKAKTYHEIVNLKKCYTLANYFTNITENVFSEIYDFLGKFPENKIVANRQVLSFVDREENVVKTIPVIPRNESFNAIEVSKSGVSFISLHDLNEYYS